MGWGVFAVALLSAALFATSVRRAPRGRRIAGASQLAMCGLLGIGFMLLEVVLVERTSLLLGHPTVAFAVVVTSLLCALGLGSMLSGRLAPEESSMRTLAVAALSLLVVVGSGTVLTAEANALRALGPTTRAATIAMTLFTVAIPLGTLLPSAIRIAKATGAATPAGCWSTNASCSVLGTLAAALLVRSHGFDVTNRCTWLAYSAALLLWLSLSSSVRATDDVLEGSTT